MAIGADAFRRLIARRPEAAAALLRTMATRLRSTEASLLQGDKLASLGTLAAGLAHELNNPAAAIQRSVDYLNEAFDVWRRRTVELGMLDLRPEERHRLQELELAVAECVAARQDDAVARKQEPRLTAHLEARASPVPGTSRRPWPPMAGP
jgi:signal transduction histidine kinase